MTGKQLAAKLDQEQFDVKRYQVVFDNGVRDGSELPIVASVRVDNETKKIILAPDHSTGNDAEIIDDQS